jgi:hypothetical protein
MSQSTPTPAPGNPFNIWINLSTRLDAVRAVASCASSATDIHGLPPLFIGHIEHLGNLCGALEDLIELARQDLQSLEPHLKGV